MSEHSTVNVYMVAAGQYHDIDYARLELLKLLAENEKIRTHVAENCMRLAEWDLPKRWQHRLRCSQAPEPHSRRVQTS